MADLQRQESQIRASLRRTPSPNALRWAELAVGPGSRVTRIAHLKGGISHANHALTIADRGGRPHRLVLRRWARPDWKVTDPEFDPRREITVLSLVSEIPVATPEVVAADADGEECDVPALLLTRLPGQSPMNPGDLPSFLAQLARVLPEVHAVEGRAPNLLPAYQTFYEVEQLTPPPWAADRRVWERALEMAASPPPNGPKSLIHRDYHPGNTLWSRGTLVGVVDWSYGSWGPGSVDVAHMRWNLAMEFGARASDNFLTAYTDATGGAIEHHPYWDIVTALDVLPDLGLSLPPSSQLLRLERHVATATARLS
jgi:aminoglycoside phosphotransferase (APT) family kinase protein